MLAIAGRVAVKEQSRVIPLGVGEPWTSVVGMNWAVPNCE
jgi:hypothetical protein